MVYIQIARAPVCRETVSDREKLLVEHFFIPVQQPMEMSGQSNAGHRNPEYRYSTLQLADLAINGLCSKQKISFPVEIRVIIKSYIYESLNNQTIREAVKMWIKDRESAMVRYGNISHWDVSSVTNMSHMFHGASSFNEPLDSWDVSNVTDMSGMFDGATSFNQSLDSWDVRNVTYMGRMFYGASSFNMPLNSWDVSRVLDMSEMFNGASSFNQPLGSWDVSNVDYMTGMFCGATSFKQSLDSWDLNNVNNRISNSY
jgi:surface protein